MIEVCEVCGCEVALLHPAALLKLVQEIGPGRADEWRDCYLCKGYVRRWKVEVDA